jgi:hypothetical protein
MDLPPILPVGRTTAILCEGQDERGLKPSKQASQRVNGEPSHFVAKPNGLMLFA